MRLREGCRKRRFVISSFSSLAARLRYLTIVRVLICRTVARRFIWKCIIQRRVWSKLSFERYFVRRHQRDFVLRVVWPKGMKVGPKLQFWQNDFLVSSRSSVLNGSTGENCVTNVICEVRQKCHQSCLVALHGFLYKVVQKIGRFSNNVLSFILVNWSQERIAGRRQSRLWQRWCCMFADSLGKKTEKLHWRCPRWSRFSARWPGAFWLLSFTFSSPVYNVLSQAHIHTNITCSNKIGVYVDRPSMKAYDYLFNNRQICDIQRTLTEILEWSSWVSSIAENTKKMKDMRRQRGRGRWGGEQKTEDGERGGRGRGVGHRERGGGGEGRRREYWWTKVLLLVWS